MPEAVCVKLCGHSWLVQHGVVALLGFGRRDIADRPHQAAVIEPVDPFQRRELDGFEAPPRLAPMDDLGLVKPVDGLGEGVVIAVANAADRGFDSGFSQALRIFDRDVLAAAIAV